MKMQQLSEASRVLVCSYAFILLLHMVLPSRVVEGYCCDSDGKPLVYRLNGIIVHLAALAVFYQDRWALPGGVTRATFYHIFNDTAVAACLFGLVMSAWFYARGCANKKEEEYCARSRCTTVDQLIPAKRTKATAAVAQEEKEIESKGKSRARSRSRGKCAATPTRKRSSSAAKPKTASKQKKAEAVPIATATATAVPPTAAAEFFLGCEWNPRVLGVDVKMFLYIVGATYLQVNLCSALEVQTAAWGGRTSVAMCTYVGLFTFFLCEYLIAERVHLYTYDLFAEKVGMKLIWGCCFFYPFLYCVGVHPLVAAPRGTDITPAVALAIAALYFFGWVLTRGANLQKFYFKCNPAAKTVFFGLLEQRTLPGAPRVLVSGFWGQARHLNYAGEILQGIALALPGLLVAADWSGKMQALAYPCYYVALFVPRQADDDALCEAKYGAATWKAYVKAVPARIFPGVW